MKIGVFAIILNDKQEVLLAHRRDYDFWNLPGGGVEKNESPWTAVIREVLEETGLRSKVNDISGIYYKPHQNELVLVFNCQVIGGKLQKTDEADKLKYFPRDALPNNLSSKHAERIHDAFKNKVNLKEQTGPSYKEKYT